MTREVTDKAKRRQSGGGNPLLTIAVIAIAVVAIRRQLRLPKGERTWHGTVDVPVPFDFRRPTTERMRHSMWAPDDPRLVMPMAFGIGWSINVARLLRREASATN